jgi:general secretion pathway protein B
MSLILEALRKSEAERQRGRAPGLFVEQMATRPAARAKAPAWAWGLGALLLAAVLLLGWREWSREPRGQVPNQERGQVQFPAPAPAGTPAQAPAAAPSMPAESQAPRPLTPPATVAAAAAREPATVAAESAPAATAAAPATPEAPTPGPSPMPPAPDAASPAEVNLTPFPAPAESLPSLASLDAGTRAQLPPLKLSMHVFAEQPAQRFVILDGRRMGEGASPAAGIVLEEIRREGLVLSVNGQRLLLARP